MDCCRLQVAVLQKFSRGVKFLASCGNLDGNFTTPHDQAAHPVLGYRAVWGAKRFSDRPALFTARRRFAV